MLNTVTRRTFSPLLPLIIASIAIVSACSSSTPIKAPDATKLIQSASTNFNSLSSLHFSLTAQNISPGLYSVTTAQGDVVRPDKLKADANVEPTAGSQIGLSIIFVNNNQYVDIGKIGQFNQTTIFPNLLLIFDKQQGIGGILSQFQSPSAAVADTINGVSTWKITGTVSSVLLNPLTGSTSTTANQLNATLWIGQSDLQMHQVTLVGKAISGDTDKTSRTFTLSNFNESITISSPK